MPSGWSESIWAIQKNVPLDNMKTVVTWIDLLKSEFSGFCETVCLSAFLTVRALFAYKLQGLDGTKGISNGM